MEQLLAAQPLIGSGTRPFRQVSVGPHRLTLEQRAGHTDGDLAYLYDDGSGIWALPLRRTSQTGNRTWRPVSDLVQVHAPAPAICIFKGEASGVVIKTVMEAHRECRELF